MIYSLSADTGRGNLIHEVFHLRPAFAADRESIHAIQTQRELQAFIGLTPQLARAKNLHPDDTLPRGLHLAQYANHHFGLGVHRHPGRIDPRQIDFHPRLHGRRLQRLQRMARSSLRPDDALLLRLADHVHRPALLLVPVFIEHAVQQQNVDIVRIQLTPEAIQIRPHLRRRRSARLR